jgi:para-aminobenzoate synthetase / 4-amino-4-deoxychorismate lyase
MPYILLESLRPSGKDQLSLRITAPKKILQSKQLIEVPSLLVEVEQEVMRGNTAIGFLCYEAGFAFLPNMPSITPFDFPLIWFAIVKDVDRLPAGTLPPEMQTTDAATVKDLTLSENFESYQKSIAQIKDYIEAGDTYQVNFTMRYNGGFHGSPRLLYNQLRSQQRVNYAAYIETEEWAILSLSPELFFRKEGRNVMMKPMKGTAPRGRTPEEDQVNADALRNSEKERSENLMIVDLLRNDLGKVCETGSIQVEQAMEIEKYETLLQMTSSLKGRLKTDVTMADLFRATFPSGSVTGAPKVRTMQIIHEQEHAPRKIYTGCIGFFSSDVSVFNVAIRTACIDLKKHHIEMGVGSGILFEADPSKEFEECALKGKFLTEPRSNFQLLETILWQYRDGYRHLDLHMERLMKSAGYFLFCADRKSIEAALKEKEMDFPMTEKSQRVRLLLEESGEVRIEASPLEPLESSVVRVCFSSQQTNSNDRYLFHKTTNRHLYDSELRKARANGFFDVIFKNDRNEITEGAISNIFVVKEGTYHTPPLSCGVLDGTFRRHLLEAKLFPTQERVLYEEDLKSADSIYLSNALRGLLKAILVSSE